jgi:hypothetical protein
VPLRLQTHRSSDASPDFQLGQVTEKRHVQGTPRSTSIYTTASNDPHTDVGLAEKSDGLGGRGWQVRLPAGATWLSLRDDEDDPAPHGPGPAFGFGEPPVDDGTWATPGY